MQERIAHCRLCPRQCGALRDETSNRGGYCGMPSVPVVARAALHFWEEPCISGEKGSGAVFFSGCTLGCVYCQNYEISHKRAGKPVTVERLAEIFHELEQAGAENINLVNPTHYALAIRRALSLYRPRIPVVYNTGGYERVETLRLLEGFIDVYLPDLKYISDERSEKYSDAADYFAFAGEALLEMSRQTGRPAWRDGMLVKGMLVRHLVLPQGTGEAIKVADWLAGHLPDVPVSVMSQYTPCGQAARFPELARTVTRREYDKVLGHLIDSGMENCFVQELDSGSRRYIPDFDGEGV